MTIASVASSVFAFVLSFSLLNSSASHHDRDSVIALVTIMGVVLCLSYFLIRSD